MANESVATATIQALPIRSMGGETYQSSVLAVNPAAPRHQVMDAICNELYDVHGDLDGLQLGTVNEDGDFQHQMSPEAVCNMARRCMNALDRVRTLVDVLHSNARECPAG